MDNYYSEVEISMEIKKLVNYCLGNFKRKHGNKEIKELFYNLNGEVVNKDTPDTKHRGKYLLEIVKKNNYKNNFYICFKDDFFIDISKLVKNIPIIGFNRCTKFLENSNIVLFPLEGYQLYNNLSKQYFNKIDIEKKIPKLIWRGSMSGTVNTNFGGTYHMCNINKYLPKENDLFYYICYSRFKFCYYNSLNKFVDAGFTNNHQFLKNYQFLCKEKIGIEEQCKYRYHIALNGNDLASSLPWQLLNHNVVFIPYPFRYESIFTYDLQPWIHFVPVSNDFFDFEKNFDIINNDIELCREISENAHRYMIKFLSKEFYDNFTKQILDRYIELF